MRWNIIDYAYVPSILMSGSHLGDYQYDIYFVFYASVREPITLLMGNYGKTALGESGTMVINI